MNYILDLALIMIFVITITVYYKRGFVKSVLGLGKVILAVVFSSMFGRALGQVLADKFMNAKMTGLIHSNLTGLYDAGTEAFDLSVLAGKIPPSLGLLAEKSGVNMDKLLSGYSADTAASGDKLYELSEKIALPIAGFISAVLGFIIVFIVAYLLLMLASFVIEAIAELPIIRGVNRLLGLLLGVVCAFIFAFLFVFAVNLGFYLIEAGGSQAGLLESIDKSILFKFFSQMRFFFYVSAG